MSPTSREFLYEIVKKAEEHPAMAKYELCKLCFGYHLKTEGHKQSNCFHTARPADNANLSSYTWPIVCGSCGLTGQTFVESDGFYNTDSWDDPKE